MKKLTTKGK